MRLADRADALRDARRFRDAAILYEQALELWPRRAGIQVQAGHMFKEAGDRAAAERHYLAAAARLPEDADLALQLGHFYKIADRPAEAMAQYRRALGLRPDWGEATRELAYLEQAGGGLREVSEEDASVAVPERDETIVRALLPGPPAVSARTGLDAIELRRLGARRERSEWGLLPVLSGVEAVRGVCFSRTPLTRVELHVDGTLVHAEPPVAFPVGSDGVVKHVFNIWVDLSDIGPGLHRVAIVLTGAEDVAIRRHDHVIVAAPLDEADHPASDALITLDPADPRGVEEQVRARPSMVRSPARSVLRHPIRTILVLRTDQLGDVVVSVPAMRRLRALFPEAHIVGLVTDANVDLARGLGLFDETIVVNFPDDLAQRRRVMTAVDQQALRARLAPYAFDIAIDLATSHMSRPLLLLSGARYLFGFHDAEWTWLSAGLEGGTHDPKNDLESAPQSGKIRALIERLGTIVDSGAAVIRRDDLDPARLAAFGVAAGRYVVLHTGARIAFSRWPGYAELAAELLARTDRAVVMMTDDATLRDTLDPRLLGSDRFCIIDDRLDFDDFDALLSFCAAFVGNDSGPKHLAALRGVPVVSIHAARVNWNEWGQEQTGSILTRRVPCAGCALYHQPDECGKGYACIAGITVDEVLDAVLVQLSKA